MSQPEQSASPTPPPPQLSPDQSPTPENDRLSWITRAGSVALLSALATGIVPMSPAGGPEHRVEPPASATRDNQAIPTSSDELLGGVPHPIYPKPTDTHVKHIKSLSKVSPKPKQAHADTVPVKKHHRRHHKTPDLPTVIIDDKTIPENTTPKQSIEIGSVPTDVETIMQTDTVYLPWVGCSGMLVRNAEGVAVGIVTAEHCGLKDLGDGTNLPRIKGADGNYYVVMRNGSDVMQGESMGNLTKVGSVGEFMVPPIGDRSQDVAFGAFAGHDLQEVVDNYSYLTEQAIQQLKLGDPAYMSGWPIDQDNNHGAMKRQSFAMSVLGSSLLANTTAGESIHVVWTAVKSTADGAECSFGSSGSEGFIVNGDGKRVSMGALAAFFDLNADTYLTREQSDQTRAFLEDYFNVTLEPDVTAVCGYAYELPVGDKGMRIKVVSSENQIPGHEIVTPEYQVSPAFLEQSRSDFFDPTKAKNVIHGEVETITNEAGKTSYGYIENPVYFEDPTNGDVLFGSYDPTTTDGLKLTYGGNINGYIIDRTTDADPVAEVVSTQGAISTSGDTFTDTAGQTFGQILPEAIDIHDFYHLVKDADGNYSFIQNQGKGGGDPNQKLGTMK